MQRHRLAVPRPSAPPKAMIARALEGTGCCQCRPVASDDVELRRNPRASAPRPPWDRTNNLRVGRPTGRQHTQLTRGLGVVLRQPTLPRF
eukprot:scaffold74620_cov101-Phaeocystis_antarctica.AAC.5